MQERWEGIEPSLSIARPEAGWQVDSSELVPWKALSAEMRTGKAVELVERYWGPDGFLSLCYCWFYYDAEDRLVDVEWQYCSD